MHAYIFESGEAVVVLEEGEFAEDGLAVSFEAGGVRVGGQPRFEEVEGELILGEAHLDDAVGVVELVVGILLVLLPSEEVGRILAVRVASSLL